MYKGGKSGYSGTTLSLPENVSAWKEDLLDKFQVERTTDVDFNEIIPAEPDIAVYREDLADIDGGSELVSVIHEVSTDPLFCFLTPNSTPQHSSKQQHGSTAEEESLRPNVCASYGGELS